MRGILMFLALLSAAGIGQGLFRVRALDYSSQKRCNEGNLEVSNPIAFSMAQMWGPRKPNTSASTNSGIRSTRAIKLQPFEDSDDMPYSASALARRQGPAVLSTAEGSANT